MSLTVPPQLALERADLRTAFMKLASEAGISSCSAAELFVRLPTPLCDAPAFLCAMGHMWRYEFGLQLDGLPNDSVAFGTTQCPEVSWLVKGLVAARERLTEDEFSSVVRNLGPIERHLDALTELAPLSRISTSYRPEYEPPDCGSGSRRIDWRFTPESGSTILLEVKCRVKDLIAHLSDISHAAAAGAKEAPEPTTDPPTLFRDIVQKFRPADPSSTLQGAWIYTAVKQEIGALEGFFQSLDHTRIHFALLADWKDDASIVVADGVRKEDLLSAFSLEGSERFLFRGGES